ncbi:MAG: hypothetical protein MUF84_13715 [Anaerolineae bacterium]|jgi:hypothetical protein|nr:hypothetical protein [Anaerolineae bacterium]
MSIDVTTPWHKASYDTFLNERLPVLLAERLPLLGYTVAATGMVTCRVTVTLAGASGPLDLAFDLPRPDDDGIFEIDGTHKVVLPLATNQDLCRAEIWCVGEQLYDAIAARLGRAPADLRLDRSLARAWLPLDTWVKEFMARADGRFVSSQPLDTTNWLAKHTHLRRLLLPECEDVIAPGQLGRVCPFEVPEGPNMGHIFTVAAGATIRDGRLVILDGRPEATLGLSASMIPLLEHDDPNRLLMGVNMLRQWVPQQTPELALVQTGNEPDVSLIPEFWAGRNLLTAFVSWGAGTFEDGIIVSESCARRFDAPYALQAGDKLSNRHGTMGVVSQILPDDQMPHLPDGTPAELVYNFASLHRRMNFGQIREAVLGRIAHKTDDVMVVPPFAAPSSDQLRAKLVSAGLPGSGMEILTMGRNGLPLQRPSAVGWVYWGRLVHLAKDKLVTSAAMGARWGQVQGEMENFMLRDLGAFEIIRENLNTRAARRPDADTLVQRVAEGPVEQSPPPTPMLVDLVGRLRVAGIETQPGEGGLAFRLAEPEESGLRLARPVPHPWLPGHFLSEIGDPGTGALSNGEDIWDVLFPPGGWWQVSDLMATRYRAVTEANDKLERLIAAQMPERLVNEAVERLGKQVGELFDVLLTPVQLRLSERVLFSARTVLVPGTDLTLEQVGMPEEMAWALFGPLVGRELGGDEAAVAGRTDLARRLLDAVMARSWVMINRAPTLTPTTLLAFHPVRVPDSALHLHPLLCKWLDADFDGDQAAVFLPITEDGQREAAERLSVAAHLTRDPGLLTSLVPALDMLFGLTKLGLDPAGLAEISLIAGEPVAAHGGLVNGTSLAEVLGARLAGHAHEGEEGEAHRVPRVLSILDRLMKRGFEVAKASGASLNPFLGQSGRIPPAPRSETPDAWQLHAEAMFEALASCTDYDAPDLGPQLLMAKARGAGLEHLAGLVGGRGPVLDVEGRTVLVRHGYGEGLTSEELFACVNGARRGFAQVFTQWEQMGATFRERNVTRSYHVLTRALRAKHPGLVFARAAASGEVDPLVDVEARLLAGLPITG